MENVFKCNKHRFLLKYKSKGFTIEFGNMEMTFKLNESNFNEFVLREVS